ncbi:hypothetical protein FHY25_004305 [Xanthomonas arboricola]|uniref:hypothetical protein n=1 Tax=Xanthomonas campestris TaxID=339 RepID=UPI0023EA275A|nr:hypothetical protein [Xanthomonas campestris]MCW2009567.1 hypothetical protein [Xanthomonas campestris]
MDNNACLGACAEDGAVWGDGSGCWPRGARSDASAPLTIGSSSRSALQEALAGLDCNNESPSFARVL